jgi:hypothetical protein
MPIPHVSPEALRDAMETFDRELRDTSDWADWEQNRAHRYALDHEGQHYPVKQIVSLATGMPVSEFSGGEAAGQANQYAAERGFVIVELRRRNPTWVRDELMLALDMYLRYAGNPPPKGSAEIEELSQTLNRLGRYLGIATEDRFRNVNGAYMKLMNFRRLDPVFTEAGRRGLSRGGQAEEEIWKTFASDPERCHAVAQSIRQALAHAQNGETIADLAGDGMRRRKAGLSPRCTAATSATWHWSRLRSGVRWPGLVNWRAKPASLTSVSVMETTAKASSNAITPSPSTR